MISNGTLHISSRKPMPNYPKILISIDQCLDWSIHSSVVVVVVYASFLLVVLFLDWLNTYARSACIDLILFLCLEIKSCSWRLTRSMWDSQDIWFYSYTASKQEEDGICTMKQFTLTTSMLEEHREARKQILIHCNGWWRADRRSRRITWGFWVTNVLQHCDW